MSDLIADYRKSKRLSLRKFAQLAGVSHNAIRQWEAGIARPGPEAIGRWLAGELRPLALDVEAERHRELLDQATKQ